MKNNVFSENFYSVLHRMKTLFDLKKNINANYKQKFILDIIKKLQSMGLSKNYKYFQKKVFEKIMGLKLEKNNIESSYLCKILNKINNYMNIPEGKITRELNMNYIERMKGLIVSFYDKCLEIHELLLNIKQNKRKLVFNKYTTLIKQDNDEDMNLENEEKNKINDIINSCNYFLMNFNLKDFKLIYYSDDKKKNDANNKKFIECIQSISLKIDNVVKYLTEIENNYEIYYVIICFIGIKNQAEKIRNYLQNEFKIIKYLYDDKLSNIIRLINEFISKYDINNINEEYQEIYYEDQIESVIENYNEDNNNKNNLEEDTVYINSKFIEKLFIKDDLIKKINIDNEIKSDKEKNDVNINNANLFNDKIQNIEDNLDDLITNLTNLNKSLILYTDKNPLLYNPLSFNEKDLELLYIDLLQFCNICTTIFYSITINGLGKSEQDENKDQNKNPEDGAVYEGGYGMSGDGQGMENITKQIEDEEQLLGLRDENDNDNNDNNNDNNENKEEDAFEMKTDFKEDYNKEINEDENGGKKENENSDIEREEDSVDNNDNNKMGDKDIQDDLSEEKQNENKKKKKIDLTDKNVQIEQDNKNNNNEYKEGDDEKNNEKNENVDEDNQQKEESDNNDKNDNNSESSEEEGEKIEKLEVDKNKEKEQKEKKEKEENNEELDNENKEDKMEIEEEIEKEDNNNNINNEEKNEKEKEENENEENNEDLMPENKEINKDNNNVEEEEEINSEKNEENSNGNSSEEENNKSMKLDEENIEKEENKEKEEEKIISNPISNPEKDLGYNPLTKNKNTQGNNTAKNTKDALNELNDEENNNNDIDFDQLENLDQFKEIFDINSVLNNVYKKGKIENQRNRNKKENNNMNIENNNPIEDLNEKDKIMDNDFKFENYQDKNENNNNGLNDDDNFEMGYGTNNKNESDKIAKEKNKENKNRIKNENINKEEINQMNQEEESENNNEINTEDRKEGIKVIEDIEKNEQIKEKKEIEKVENNMEEEEDEDISMNNEQNEIEEKEEDKNEQKKEEDLFPKEDFKTDFDKNLIINTELKHSEKEANDQAISIFNNYLESNKDSKTLIQGNISNSNNLEQFFNSLLASSQNQIIKLTSLLKTILTPNLQSKLIGNYKTGKRLNMKKIISFIASNYRQDKIWLRRTLPYNRDYYITISIDNSLSMKQNNIGYYALQSMLILIKSLQKVGIDNLSLFGITDDCVELYDYNNEKNMINNEKIKNILNYFKFNFESKNSFDFSMQNFLAKNIQKIENNTINDRNKLKYNINFIISDGRFNKNNVKGLTAVAKEKGILYVFIIIDRYKFDDKNSILNTMTVKYDDKGEIEIEKYLSDFPFQYYTVVQDIEDLPEILKGILVKWIETVSN